MDDQEMRSTKAQLAALTRAARTDGAEISAPGRAAFLKNFEDGHYCKYCGQLPPVDQSLPPAQRQRAARAALRAHMIRLNRASAISRRTAATYIGLAQAAGQQLAEDQAQLDAATE